MTDQIIKALQLVFATYGLDFTKMLECLFREETAHFTSGEWVKCFSPGMQATAGGPTWGWTSLAGFWNDNPKYEPTGIWNMTDNNSAMSPSTGKQNFIMFPSIEAAFMSVAFEIQKGKGGNFGAWNSNDPIAQQKYVMLLKQILPRLTSANCLTA